MESGNNKEIKHPFAIVLAVTAGLLRLVPHYPGCTPIGAMTLFSGNKINGLSSWLIPIGVMFITDLLLYFPLEQISLKAFSSCLYRRKSCARLRISLAQKPALYLSSIFYLSH